MELLYNTSVGRKMLAFAGKLSIRNAVKPRGDINEDFDFFSSILLNPLAPKQGNTALAGSSVSSIATHHRG